MTDIHEVHDIAGGLYRPERHGSFGRDAGFSYRDIYESVPISIWIEDWSAAKWFTDDLKRRGVADIGAYFIDHPDRLRDLANMVEVLDVNWTTVTLYGAPDKQAVIDSTWGATMTDNELAAFREQIAAFASGRTVVTTEDQESRFDGQPLWIRNRATIHPDHLEDWSLVLFASSDITETRIMDKTLGGDLGRLSDILANVPCALYRRVRKADDTVTFPYVNGLGRLLPGFGPDLEDGGLIGEAIVSGASIHPDDSARWCVAWRESAERLATLDMEYRIVDPSGQAVWIRNTAAPKRVASGAIIWDGVMTSVADQNAG